MLSDVSHGETDALNRSWSFMSEAPPRPKRHKNTDDELRRSRLKKSFSLGFPRSKQQKNINKADDRSAEKLNLKKCPECKVYTLDLVRHSEEHRQNTGNSGEERKIAPPKKTTKTATNAENERKCDICGIFTMDLARHVEERHSTPNDDDEVDEGAETEVDEAEQDTEGDDAPHKETSKSKDDSFICPDAPTARLPPPKKTAKVARVKRNLPEDPAALPESSVGIKTYECLRCKASGSYATVAEHIQTRHGIRGKITFGVDYVAHLSAGKRKFLTFG